MLWSKVDLFFKGDTWQIIVVVKNVIKSILQKSYGSLSLWKYKMYKFKYLYLKIYIFYKKKFTLKLLENQNQKSDKVVFQI